MKPFKVVCINSDWECENFWERLKEKIFGESANPLENHIYTVIKYEEGYYTLEEFAAGDVYRMEFFIPVDEVKREEEVYAKISQPQFN